jgi:hypothetical protein
MGRSGPVSSTAAIVLLGCAGVASAADPARSVYTDISEKKCKLIAPSGEPEDDGGLSCHGPAGYSLLALSNDLRATVNVVTPDGTEAPLEFYNVITGHFSTLGPRAEWRVGKDGLPYALIVRVSASEDPEDPRKKTSYLAVARIGTEAICVTDRIDPGPDDNARARAAADASHTRPCINRTIE